MDNLTHSLAGVLLSRAGFNRMAPHATALLVLAANAPDIDVFSYFVGGVDTYFEWHRGLTHAIALTPVVALVPVLLVRLLARKQPPPLLRAWAVSAAGVASHWLLDYTNAYGIRLLEPFSSAWPALDITYIVDLWIWAALLLATAWPWLARLVSSEIGAKSGTGRGWAIFALAFILCFDVARWFLHQRAVAVQQARIYDGQIPRRVLAYPTFYSPLHWTGVVETDTFWVVQRINLLDESEPSAPQIRYKPQSSPAIEAARQTRPFRNLERWSRSLLWQAVPANQPEGGVLVEAVDLRFGFSARATVDSAGRVMEASFRF